MQVSVERLSDISRRLVIEVPENQVSEEFTKRLKSVAKKAKIDGFRKGKVPMRVIQQHYGESILQEAQVELMRNYYPKALDSENLTPASPPSFILVSTEKGRPLVFNAEFEVYPEINLADFSSLQITQLTAEITDADIDATVENIRKQKATWEDVERAAQNGDKVIIDFVGSIDGEEFAGGKAEDTEVTLGENRFIPGFEDAIVGHQINDEFIAEVNFPEDYQSEKLAGKAASFAITVKAVKHPILPELNDEFAKSLGVEGDMQALRDEIRGNMQRELVHALETEFKTSVMNALHDAHEFDVPKALVDNEIKHMAEHMRKQMRMDTLPENALEAFNEPATRRVKLGLLVAELIKKHDITADIERVNEKIKTLSEVYDDAPQMEKLIRSNPEQMQSIQAGMIEQQVVEKVVEKAKVEQQTKTFDEIIKQHRH